MADVEQSRNTGLEKETHRLLIGYREDGTKADQVIITNDFVVPTGKGEAAIAK